MSIGPRDKPYPLIAHIDSATNKPVRIAESNTIFANSVSAITVSATNYLNIPATTEAYSIVFEAKNKSNTNTIPKGTPVIIAGATGSNVLIQPASASNTNVPIAVGISNHVAGLTQDEFAPNAIGHVITQGLLAGFDGPASQLNTNSFNVGDVLYVSSNGKLTNVKLPAPYEAMVVGFVTKVNANNGEIFVKISTPVEINDLAGMNLSAPLINGDLITYDLNTSTFTNKQNISISGLGNFGSLSATTLTSLTVSATNSIITKNVSATSSLTIGDITLTNPSSTTLNVDGQIEQTNGGFSSTGDFKRISVILRATTTSSTPVELFIDGTSKRLTIPDNTACNITIRTIAQAGTYVSKFGTYDRKFLVVRGQGAATTQIIGPIQTIATDTGSNNGSPPAAWNLTVSADTTLGCVRVFATGQVSTEVKWVSEVNIIQVSYLGLSSVDQVITSFFANNEPGLWLDPSGNNIDWRRNQLTYTEEFDNAVWTKTNLITTGSWVNQAVAPDGTTTAEKLIETVDVGAQDHRLVYGPFTTLAPCVFSIYAKASERSNIIVRTLNSTVGRGFNLTNGTTFSVVSLGFNDPAAYGIDAVPNAAGWYRCWIVANMTGNQYMVVSLHNGTSNNYQGNGSGVFAWGAQLDKDTTTPTPYQKIVTPEITYVSDVQSFPVLYQTFNGDTPLTAVEQPVGLILDKSKGLALGPELITNGTFDSSTWWALGSGWSISGGTANANTTGIASLVSPVLNIVAGKMYIVKFTATVTAGNISSYLGGNNVLLNFRTGTFTVCITAGTNNFLLAFDTLNACVATIDNVSVKEVYGNHAFQSANTSYRPTLRARYNLLTYSEQFDNAAWGKTSVTVSANNTSAPDGTITAELLIPTTDNLQHRTENTAFTSVIGGTYTFSCYAKSAGYYLEMWAGAAYGGAVFNLDTGTVITSTAGNTPSIQYYGNGWYRCSITMTATLASNGWRINPNNTGTILASFAGNGTSGIYAWGAQLNYGSSALPYQRIAAATDYATGPNFPPYLDFDGSNDYLTTNSINFSSTNKVTVCAGATKLTDAFMMLVEHSVNAGSNNGAFQMYPNTDYKYYYGSRGSTLQTTAGNALSGVVTKLITGQSDTANSNVIIRENGSLVSLNTASQVNVAYGNYPIYIGSRAGTGNYFNGRLHGLIIRGAQSDTEQLSVMEKYLGSKSGVTI